MVRGAAAGMCLILAAALAPLAVRSSIARFGAVFALSAAAYCAASAPAMVAAMPGVAMILKVPAMSAGVFFWWFALALFCDMNRWHWSRLIPFAVVAGCAILVPLGAPEVIISGSYWGSELINAALMVHVIVIILNGSKDDLVEPRRKFRTTWVGAIAGTIILITLLHTLQLFTALPQAVHLAQAVLLLLVSAGVTMCCIGAQAEFFPADRAPEPKPKSALASGVAAADRHLVTQLRAAMIEGAYTESGLTVGALAERLGAPEHRLRAVINQQLGYRNFAAFLNEHRVSAAKAALADPAQARRQVLQIALDLGYGSIAPFNRAFRAVVGTTPTQFRRDALERACDTPPVAAQ
ncbi:MAG: helix-turn-helix domain-containing protein [Oceanicaulis sp.]